MTEGYDVIGDVHGYASKLVALLKRLGYEEKDGSWRHSSRRVIFVGDLIDRGPEQLESVSIARRMTEFGHAIVLAGNHEFNAVSFHTHDGDDGYLRPHTEKNLQQHHAFLSQIGLGSATARDLVGWFKSLPLWLEQDGLRVVHACWSAAAIDFLGDNVSETNSLTDDLVRAANTKGSDAWQAVEHLLKGPEILIDPPYRDKGGHERDHARFQWWLPEADRLDIGALIPPGTTTEGGEPYPPLPPSRITPPVEPYRDDVPVIFGHYWSTGAPVRTSPTTACVDYSAGKGGPLVAYRWSGESELDDANFVSSA